MSREIHKKVLTPYFDHLLSGDKTFEMRLADWQCEPGDILILEEVDSATKRPTGRSMRKKVGFILRTKDISWFAPEEVERHGFQVISLLEENKL